MFCLQNIQKLNRFITSSRPKSTNNTKIIKGYSIIVLIYKILVKH